MEIKIESIWILIIIIPLIGYTSACPRAKAETVLEYKQYDAFTITTTAEANQTEVLNILRGSNSSYTGREGQNETVTFQNKNRQAIYFKIICVTVKCVKRVHVLYHGPWTNAAFRDITKRKKWLELSPTSFAEEKTTKTCKSKKICVKGPGLLTKFSLTFIRNTCKQCSSVKAKRLYAKECREKSNQGEFEPSSTNETDGGERSEGVSVILDSNNYQDFVISTKPNVDMETIVKILNSSGEIFEANSTDDKFSITFEVKDRKAFDVQIISLWTQCVQKIEVLYHGPWTNASYLNAAKQVVWLEDEPVAFVEENHIKNSCKFTASQFEQPKELTSFRLTFVRKLCRKCDTIAVKNIYATARLPQQEINPITDSTIPLDNVTSPTVPEPGITGENVVTSAGQGNTPNVTSASGSAQ